MQEKKKMQNEKQLQLSETQLMKASCSCLIVFLAIIIYKNCPINEGKHIICNLHLVSTLPCDIANFPANIKPCSGSQQACRLFFKQDS